MRMCACRGTAGFAHVSCLAEQAKILRQEAEDNNLDAKARTTAFRRWDTCSLCEQDYHGVVRCALGWACWKTYVGRPETDDLLGCAMSLLGIGLFNAEKYADALSVTEANLAKMRRLGESEENILRVLGNLAGTYEATERLEEALRMREEIYSGHVRLFGEEHIETCLVAENYALSNNESGALRGSQVCAEQSNTLDAACSW